MILLPINDHFTVSFFGVQGENFTRRGNTVWGVFAGGFERLHSFFGPKKKQK